MFEFAEGDTVGIDVAAVSVDDHKFEKVVVSE